MNNSIPVIAIDGPSGSGKGTVSQLLARQLGWQVLESGMLYRVVAVGADLNKIPLSDIKGLCDFSAAMEVEFSSLFEGSVLLNGKEISNQARLEESAERASRVSAIPALRTVLLERQRAFRRSPGLVADGRDMGTVVFPSADLKIFLTATLEERARRRYKQLKNKGVAVTLRYLLQDIRARDERDAKREISPLKAADDAVVLDATTLSIEQVAEKILELAKARQLI